MLINELFSLKGLHALITGGNSGIGLAIAQGLQSAGAEVSIIGNNIEKTQECWKTNQFSEYFCADLSQLDAIKGLVDKICEKCPKIDILVNAAGINLRQPFDQVTTNAWQAHLNLMLGAPFFLIQSIAPLMQKNHYGRIINIASLQSYRALNQARLMVQPKGELSN